MVSTCLRLVGPRSAVHKMGTTMNTSKIWLCPIEFEPLSPFPSYRMPRRFQIHRVNPGLTRDFKFIFSNRPERRVAEYTNPRFQLQRAWLNPGIQLKTKMESFGYSWRCASSSGNKGRARLPKCMCGSSSCIALLIRVNPSSTSMSTLLLVSSAIMKTTQRRSGRSAYLGDGGDARVLLDEQCHRGRPIVHRCAVQWRFHRLYTGAAAAKLRSRGHGMTCKALDGCT